MNNCPFCGGQLAPGARKCRHCGEWVVPQQYRTSQPPRQGYAPDEYNYTQDSAGQPTPPTNNYPGGFFDTYFIKAFFGRYADFSGYLGRRDFWLSLLAAFIITLGLTGLVFAINWFLVPVAQTIIWYCVSILWGALLLVPFLALSSKRLRDAGLSPLWNFIILLPFIGPLVLLFLWLQPEQRHHRMLPVIVTGIDVVLGLLCIAILILGMLMAAGSFGQFGSNNSTYSDTLGDSVNEEELFLRDTIVTRETGDEEQPAEASAPVQTPRDTTSSHLPASEIVPVESTPASAPAVDSSRYI